jgi:hypothetical protein
MQPARTFGAVAMSQSALWATGSWAAALWRSAERATAARAMMWREGEGVGVAEVPRIGRQKLRERPNSCACYYSTSYKFDSFCQFCPILGTAPRNLPNQSSESA